ncbi:uncharacterized protein E0L32_004533 [Thyridium curvatum]|uniref:LysM domain-containing protein n=1 Tax=Thyridium curvatum TaxID=1093900 RepID=A0A507B7Z9_9PEZI|nr:uncharacterized protein E0L32_004533 [Thyridium curvatum]TPX15256.1 hypothetical protein E0L32_004533 [Thyridium curvatum]
MTSKIILLFIFPILSWAQQLNGTYMNVDYPGLSDGCKKALNTSVACPLLLSNRALSNNILDLDSAKALCVDSCYRSLQTAKTAIVAACKASSDTIIFSGSAQPASYIVDNYIHAFNVSCRKDAATGQLCEPFILQWSQQGFMRANETCSDCWLGGRALQLNSPFGYDEVLAENFASLTSSCSVAGKYTFTKPPTTTSQNPGSSSTSPPSSSATPVCRSSYKLKAQDYDCNAVAKALKVSTYTLLIANDLDLYCQNFLAAVDAQATLCVPEQCQIYTWQAGDSCESVLVGHPGVTWTQFLSWNPQFNSLCGNTGKFIGYEICIGPPGGGLNATATSPLPGTSVTAPVPPPTNAAGGSTKPCGKWYTVQSGDTCGVISVANGLTLDDFYFLNPSVDAQCTNLLLGVAYCVAPVGDILTYSGHPKPTQSGPWATLTVPTASYPPVNTEITTTKGDPGYVATTSLLPTASGTVPECPVYRNFNANQSDLNACGYVAYAYGVTVDQLQQWNPSLGGGDGSACALQKGFSYCVESPGGGGTGSPTTPDTCLDLNATEPGTVQGCSCFTQVRGYQNRSGYTCDVLAASVPITLAQLLSWNTWLGKATASVQDCNKALYANLAYYGVRAVCIGVGSGTGGSLSTSSPTRSSTSTSVSSAAPTQTGSVKGCRQYYTVQSGDYCELIQTKFGITFQQFLSWNPSVGSNSDCIERALVEDGHRVWGFVIYRCAYDNNTDAAWARLLQALRRYARETLEYYKGLDILDRFQLTVVEDKTEFDGATTSTVRQHFREWASAPDTVAHDQGVDGAQPGLSQRYRYCIRVDAEALDRIAAATADLEEGVDDTDDDIGDEDNECFVDLVWKEWEPSVPDPREMPMEAIEGCTRPDVGWMRVGVRGAVVEMYEALRDQNAWYTEYRRPYEVVYR